MSDTLIAEYCDSRGADDSGEVARALGENLSGTGDACLRYEAALASWFDTGAAVATSSGSSALIVALAALGLEADDEVILPATAPLCSVQPLLELRLVPVFCDVRPSLFSLDLANAERLITPRTRAILEIPMWGHPIPASEVRDFACAHRFPLVMDLAHCLGTRWNGRHLSAYADISTFSTHASKMMSTGEGGFILTDDSTCAQMARLYSRFGDLDGVHFGLNFKLGGLQAALGISRLQRLDEHLKLRARNVKFLCDHLDNPLLDTLPIPQGGESNNYALIVRVRKGRARPLIDRLACHGIPSDINKYQCQAAYEFPLLREYRRECPETDRLLGSVTTIPTHPGLSSADLRYMAAALASYRGADHHESVPSNSIVV